MQTTEDKPSKVAKSDAPQTDEVARKNLPAASAAESAGNLESDQPETLPVEQSQTAIDELSADEETSTPVKNKSPYSLILISSITIGLYLLTSILVKVDKLKKATHRKIWNVMLLVTALVSCLLGFFLVIQINYNMKMEWLWTVKLYHVQFGIAMTIIAVIHILWHMNYWKSIVKKNK